MARRGPPCHLSSPRAFHTSLLWPGMPSNLFVTLPPCDRTLMLPGSTTTHDNRISKATKSRAQYICSGFHIEQTGLISQEAPHPTGGAMSRVQRLALRLQSIDIETLPGNIAGLIRGQEHNGMGLVLRLTQTSQGHANTEDRHITF